MGGIKVEGESSPEAMNQLVKLAKSKKKSAIEKGSVQISRASVASSGFLDNRWQHKLSMQLLIQDVTLLKDGADMFGKQDPFLQFEYNGRIYSTKVIDEGGKHAVFDEEFELDGLQECLEDTFELECYDADVGAAEFLGRTRPLTFREIVL